MSTFYLDNLINNEISPVESISSRFFSKKQHIYKDLHLDLLKTSLNSNDIAADFDAAAIKNSIYNLLWYKPGTYLLRPEIGLNLEQFLFTKITTVQSHIIEKIIQTHLDKHEPRISLNKVLVTNLEDNETINIKIFYNVKSSQLSEQISLNFNSNFYQT